ncbi:MAG: glycosyltransferase [Chitinophagales bacterium]|nr:glycosyltransferase [Chitinophagales bacterium]
MPKKKVLVLYEYFYPGFKAGGPIQSLVNMVIAMQHKYDFYIATTAYDMQAKEPYKNVALNQWTDVVLTNNGLPVKVWYSSTPKPSFKELLQVIKTANCKTIYINGFYTHHFLFPLLFKKLGLVKNVEWIVAPRGMLQNGALQIRALQKKIYFSLLKLFRLMKYVNFHATTKDEEIDTKKMFGNKVSVIVAKNIPKQPYKICNQSNKQISSLKLVFLSLITEKKNLLLLLHVLKKCSNNILLDIYGPIKDEVYWQQCLQAINELPQNISANYRGEVLPNNVQATFSQYDAMILLTKGENFGHAIYESLSVGTPVIISHFTPWNNLQEKNAGWNVDIYNEQEICTLLNNVSKLNQSDWQNYCNGAWQMAKDYYNSSDYTTNYTNLFL